MAPSTRSRCPRAGTSNGVTDDLKRWDGMRRTCDEWNGFQRDDDLWIPSGNCFVYLDRRGRPAKGPSFKVPLSTLLARRCFPFIRRFLSTSGHHPRTVEEMTRWYRLGPRRNVELYVPVPNTATKAQSLAYHVAIRNYIAWAVGKPVVGAHLGSALVALLRSLYEFRNEAKLDVDAGAAEEGGDDDNDDDDDPVQQLLAYLKDGGFLCLTDEPNQALALLYLAESFQLGDLYTQAFAHCVGMSRRLRESPEYHIVSDTSKRLIDEARAHLDRRLARTSAMLVNFLARELSEAHLGMPSGVRSHLEWFRRFLKSFYTEKFGFYPPLEFDAVVCRTMTNDFDALHDLLVDERHTSSRGMPWAAAGGLCTLQLLQDFDRQNDFPASHHPLPLLPELPVAGVNGRRGPKIASWLPLGRRGKAKARAEQRRIEHAALVRASNATAEGGALPRSDLVSAYRRFEEASVAATPSTLEPGRIDSGERVSLEDARKVRWILVYAVRQALRQATELAPGVTDDEDAPYLLTATADGLPPWRRARSDEGEAAPETGDGSAPLELDAPLEIKPDIDYFALTHREPTPKVRRPRSAPQVAELAKQAPRPLSRSNSFGRVLNRSVSLRRSVRRLRRATLPPGAILVPSTPDLSRQSSRDEIVVGGYGNGTNCVTSPALDSPRSPQWATRSSSTGSNSSASTTSRLGSAASPTDTLASSVDLPSPTFSLVSPMEASSPEAPPKRRHRWSAQYVTTPSSPSKATFARRRPMSVAMDGLGFHHAKSLGQLERRTTTSSVGVVPDPKRRYMLSRTRSSPIVLPPAKKAPAAGRGEPLCAVRSSDSWDWNVMQAFLDGTNSEAEVLEQYAELGGLTDMG